MIKTIKKQIFAVCMMVGLIFLLVGCSQADNATSQLKSEADEFQITRRITVVNLRTDNVLYEIEGRISYSVEADGDLSIVAKISDNKFTRDTIGVGQAGNGITYVVKQIEPNTVDPYHYHVKIYARIPDVDIIQ